tara:strand:- start:3890 stop:4066 length:177 start_codon:yes stop_codon:yes gene_type:complete
MDIFKGLMEYSTKEQASKIEAKWLGLIGLCGMTFLFLTAIMVMIGILGWAFRFMISPF